MLWTTHFVTHYLLVLLWTISLFFLGDFAVVLLILRPSLEKIFSNKSIMLPLKYAKKEKASLLH
jgi:hypothetical protein